jgi:hypothetical protein
VIRVIRIGRSSRQRISQKLFRPKGSGLFAASGLKRMEWK